MDAILSELRLAVRSLRRTPAITLAALITLALGIGANTAVFSVVDAVLLRPLPYPDPERLLVLYQQHQRSNVGRTRAAHLGTGFTLSGSEGPELVIGQLVSAELFDVLGVRPLLGRTFRRDENEAG